MKTNEEMTSLRWLRLRLTFLLSCCTLVNVGLAESSPSSCNCDEELFVSSIAAASSSSSSSNRSRYFCGSHLNRYNRSQQQCLRDKLYLCSGANTSAVVISDCPKGKRAMVHRCNDSFTARNDCLRQMKCFCRGAQAAPEQIVCGGSLQGVDCVPTTLYQCRRIGAALPLENCAGGCGGGKCKVIDAKGGNNNDSSNNNSNSNNSSSKTTTSTGSNETTTSTTDHEVEYVTFVPLIRSAFDP